MFFIGMEDDFRVGGGRKTVSFLDQFPPEFLEIVNFTVEHDPNGPVLVAHRLGSCVQINDRKSAMPQPDRPGNILSFAVWPPVGDHVRHFLDQISRNPLLMIVIDFAADAAHRKGNWNWDYLIRR